ncbi:Uncharacterised protein [Raoultella ornithinolytica]|nr:Uncharacterised protein [Raoultella ornithinolytica]
MSAYDNINSVLLLKLLTLSLLFWGQRYISFINK